MSLSDRFIHILHEWAMLSMDNAMNDVVQFGRESGLSMPQISTLVNLHHGGTCTISQVGNRLGVTNPAASQLIHRMVEQGLLSRVEDLDDRRIKNIELTPEGLAVVEQIAAVRRRWMEEIASNLDEGDLATIVDALGLLVSAARRLHPPRKNMEVHS